MSAAVLYSISQIYLRSTFPVDHQVQHGKAKGRHRCRPFRRSKTRLALLITNNLRPTSVHPPHPLASVFFAKMATLTQVNGTMNSGVRNVPSSTLIQINAR